MKDRRAIIVILDGVGIGEMPDAGRFGDSGSNTLANTAERTGGLKLPNLAGLGLGDICPIKGLSPLAAPLASFGRMAEASAGKDSTTGHWELAGVVVSNPFPVFPRGFPPELVKAFEKAIGRRTIGNRAASGTGIIRELGEEHVRTGRPIIYTSADSVFQVACHEDVVPVAELYRYCSIARNLLDGRWRVGRVIARPFAGGLDDFRRTPRRRDFSCPPPQPTLLDIAKDAGLPVVGIGKVDDLFAHRGFTQTRHSVDNEECVRLLLEALRSTAAGVIIANFVQFDMDWGHRNDVEAFARGLAEFDSHVPALIARLRRTDLLAITADHGNDPTTPSTDHSREYVPLLVHGPALKRGVNLGTRETFADLGRTAADWLGIRPTPDGDSFLSEIYPTGGRN